MPENVNVRGTAADSPDLVGEELGDGAHIWRVYDQVAREEDRERIGTWNRGLDNLALFAGLFSAVTTAFIIELQKDTEPDYARLTFLVLNSSAAGVPYTQEPFTIDPSTRITNCLWIASLMLSLTAALIAIMGKDWIGMYASRPVCNPRQWAEIRTYRLACVERWYMSGVIAAAPVLLHFSLVLFAAGLVFFVSSDGLSQRVAFALSLAAGGLYLITVLSAVAFPSSPFKSPATQILRRTVFATLSSMRSTLFDRPVRHPIAMLHQASLILGTVLSRPLPETIVPLDRRQRLRLRAGDISVLWHNPSSDSSASSGRSWRAAVQLFGTASRAHFVAFTRAVCALSRSVAGEYRYRWQHPRTRPWHTSILLCLRQIELSDRGSGIRSEPAPELLAESLSRLNSMTQSPEVFHAIMLALGDIATGRMVAPLVSVDLKSRLSTEIRHNWRKTDLVTLSRYMLADQHLSLASLTPRSVVERFHVEDDTPSVRSESIILAVAGLSSAAFIPDVCEMIYHHCPEITIQPRALHHLLPLLSREDDIDAIIILAQQYWHHLKDDQSFDLEVELLKRMGRTGEAIRNSALGIHSSYESVLVELLAFRGCAWGACAELVTAAYSLILSIIKEEPFETQHPCLVYAFGAPNPLIADAAWAAPPSLLRYLAPVLPLRQQSLPRSVDDEMVINSGNHPFFFDICLARTLVRLLSPRREFHNFYHWDSRYSREHPSTLELCTLRLHAQLCGSQAELRFEYRRDIINLVLETSALIRLCWEGSDPRPRTDRHTLNIMTTIARHIGYFMGHVDTFNVGAPLLILFASSRVQGPHQREVWDLGGYLRSAQDRRYEPDPCDKVSLRRLLHAVCALRPLCMKRDDVRAAWQHLTLPMDTGYTDPFWDAEGFELDRFLAPPDEGVSAA